MSLTGGPVKTNSISIWEKGTSTGKFFSEALILASLIVHGITMNNMLSYCGLIDAKIRASDKDLPVMKIWPKSEFRK